MIIDDTIDPISPVSIEHRVDEIWVDKRGGELEQYYNFIDYHFERDGGYARARAYLDEMHLVTIYGPYSSRASLDPMRIPELERDVEAYLSRRFRKVGRL